MTEAHYVEIPEAPRHLLEPLKTTFGVRTDAEVLSRALNLANVATKVAGRDHVVTLSSAAKDEGLMVFLDQSQCRQWPIKSPATPRFSLHARGDVGGRP
jgi:hypothetical protein